MPLPEQVLLCRPDFFEVRTVKNPHMDGNIGRTQNKQAWQQWETVKETFAKLGLKVNIFNPVPNLEDMVFTANAGLPFLDPSGQKKFLPSKMYAANRQGEIAPAAEWFSSHGYEIVDILNGPDDFFEGMGDAIYHRGRRLLIMGYGFRSRLEALEKIAHYLDIPVSVLHLINPHCYHLDTCLAILDENTALIVPNAFAEQSLLLLQTLFPRLLLIDEEAEAKNLAANAFCPDNKHVIINAGCPNTVKLLQENNFIPIEVDTSEFGKSGGSISCLKLSFW